MASPATAQQNAMQNNAIARALIKAQSTTCRQIIYNNTVTNPAGAVLNIPVRPVGLVLGFFVEISAVLTNTDGANAVTPTDFAGWNLLQQVNFVDLNNFTRIQTTGQHIGMLNSVRQRHPYMSALFSNGNVPGTQATIGYDAPQALGPNWTISSATPSISASGGTGTVKQNFYVPLAYSPNDLRGAIYAGVINATMQLGLVFNQFPGVVSGDSTNAVYTGSASVAITSAAITITQHYLDQLPVAKNGYPVLPVIDTNTVYELKNTFLTGLSNGQDFAIPYTNYRDFLSVILVYNDGTATNGGRPKLTGSQASNLNYVAVQTANFFNPIKNTPYLQAALQRNVGATVSDLPPGVYYFPSREKPVSTTQTGNQQIILNPANLGSVQNPYVQAYFEDFGILSALTQAGSLASS